MPLRAVVAEADEIVAEAKKPKLRKLMLSRSSAKPFVMLPGDWYVITLTQVTKTGEGRTSRADARTLDMEDYIFQVEVPIEGKLSRSSRASARRSSATSSWLRPSAWI